MNLGINIDHIAVLREARATNDPNPIDALHICKMAQADQITIHLREDRRHIQDSDAVNIINLSSLPVNLECSINADIINTVCQLNPHRVTLVPENRNEVTTEGGLDLDKYFKQIKDAIAKLHNSNIEVSLFVDPNKNMINLAKQLNVKYIELHTGNYANIYAVLYSGLNKTHHKLEYLNLPKNELNKMLENSLYDISSSSILANKLELRVVAGHGLNYQNVQNISKIKYIEELNIGQSIIARSIYQGLYQSIIDMKAIIENK